MNYGTMCVEIALQCVRTENNVAFYVSSTTKTTLVLYNNDVKACGDVSSL